MLYAVCQGELFVGEEQAGVAAGGVGGNSAAVEALDDQSGGAGQGPGGKGGQASSQAGTVALKCCCLRTYLVFEGAS